MTRAFRAAFLITAALVSCTAGAVDNTLTSGGYTGLGITPSAHLLGWGRFEFGYERQLPGALPDTSGHNFVAGFGLLPNLELVGRIAANDLNSNCFEGCGLRDLSASAKVGIGLDAAHRFRIAAGAADVGGAATNFRTYYGVLTYDEGPFQLSAGVARRANHRAGGPRSPLDGVFGGAAWQPVAWARAHVEYSDGNSWAGVRLFAPTQWLPEGWAAHVGANARLSDSNLTARSWFTAGVSIPLYKVPNLPAAGPRAAPAPLATGQFPLPAYEARALPSPPQPAAPASLEPATPLADARFAALASALQQRGLEDIFVGRMPDGSMAIRVNNATYNWNAVDALGAALGAVARELGSTRTAYRLVLTQRQLPLVAVTGQTDCLQRWIQGENSGCTAGELSTPGSAGIGSMHAGASWVVENLQPSWRTVRISLAPVLRTNVATELGVLDYSAGVSAGLGLPLWPGASVEWRVEQELVRSDDYRDGGIFSQRRIRSGTERLAFTQTVQLGLGPWLAPGDARTAHRWGLDSSTAQVSIGRFGNHFDGVHGAVRWEPGDGRHRFTLQAGAFRNSDFGAILGEPRVAKPLLGTYRYYVAPTRTYAEVTGGQFMNNDYGFQLGLRQWFSDVAVQAYLRRSRFTTGDRNSAGLELSIPIGPRRDMAPSDGFQVTGTPRFSHRLETVVGGGANVVAPGGGLLPPVPSLELVHNSDRASLIYFEDNVRRLRDAAR